MKDSVSTFAASNKNSAVKINFETQPFAELPNQTNRGKDVPNPKNNVILLETETRKEESYEYMTLEIQKY